MYLFLKRTTFAGIITFRDAEHDGRADGELCTHRNRLLACSLCTPIYRVYTKKMVGFQKLTRNLFLTLYWHNIHCQQQQLSKFLMRYQQFASRAYFGAAGPVSKMASQHEKAFCVLRFEVSRSVITVQREFRARFRIDAPAWCVFSKPLLLTVYVVPV